MIEEKLDDVLGTKIAIIKEDAKPTPGMWYYIWLKPKWQRIIVPISEYGDYKHPEFWREYIAPKIVSHYGLKEEDLSVVQRLCYSMPRGRVDHVMNNVIEPNERGGSWALFHGDDIPSSLDPKSEEKKLISGFNLTGPLLHGKAEFRVMEHEKMVESHKVAIQELIGPIPY